MELIEIPIFDADGKVAEVEGIAHDVTGLIRTAEVKQLEHNRMKNILDVIPDGVYIVSQQCDIEYINPAIEREFGPVNDRKCYEYFHGRTDVCPWCKNPDVFAGKSVQWEWYSIKNDRHYHLFDAPFKNADGSISKFEIFHDITERKLAEEELRYLRNYLFNIINSMPSVLVGVDTQCNVTQWNREAYRATGVMSQDAIGQPLDRVFPRLSGAMELVHDAIRSRQTLHNPRQVRHEDGSTRYEDMTIYPLIADGVEGAVIRIDDVTDKVNMEEMMIQSEKMLSVGGLAAGMAHEINNPIAGMMQNANVMAIRLGDRIDMPANLKAAEEAGTTIEAIRDFMEARGIPRMITAINKSGRRVSEIVNNMLNFARMSAAQISSYSLPDLLDKAIELAATDYDLKKHYDFKMIEIRKEYDDKAPPVPCEGGKIQQVLLNILRNGAHAMQEAGIRKPVFIVRTWFEKERKMVCMEIKDNGPGMDEEVRKRAFEPFYTTKPVGEGTGLGLSVSYFIISENHGGEISVNSTPGSGAGFIIRLPLEGKKP
ncbi:MAG: PAS domain S-box protein [Desulfobacteraceae bacterium]|nr:PAS domain S-box protein [Desulfobacteraceae bacterium]